MGWRLLCAAAVMLALASASHAQVPELTIDDVDRFEELLRNDPMLHNQYGILGLLEKAPVEDVRILEWLQGDPDRLTPPLLSELARRTAMKDPRQAIRWQAQAWLRAAHDGRKCQRDLPHFSLALSMFSSQEAMQAIAVEPAEFLRIADEVQRTYDLTESRTSPWWLCRLSHELFPWNTVSNRPDDDAQLRPRSEWGGQIAAARAEFSRLVEMIATLPAAPLFPQTED